MVEEKKLVGYRRGFRAGVAACAAFLTDAADEPTLAGELIEYVQPGRNWRKRFQAAVAESQRRWDEGMGRVKEQRARMTPEELEEADNLSKRA